jgi:putative acetyltransferase
VNIRPAASSDFPVLADLWFDSWTSIGISNETDWPRETVRERLVHDAAERWVLFAAEENGEVVGMLALVMAERRIDQLFVKPAFKGRGVGLTLLNFAKRELPDGIVLVTQEANARARAFYERAGFRLERSEYDDMHQRTNCHYVWKAGTRNLA